MKIGIKVNDCMVRNPIFFLEEDTILECAKMMKKYDVGSAPIVDKDMHLKGIVTEADFVRKAIVNKIDTDKPISTIMTSNVYTVNKTDDLYDVIVKMRDLNSIFTFPVVNPDKKLIGFLTWKDIIKIQPSLFDLMSEIVKDASRLENNSREMQGICEICGKLTKVYETENGLFLCKDCYNLNMKDI